MVAKKRTPKKAPKRAAKKAPSDAERTAPKRTAKRAADAPDPMEEEIDFVPDEAVPSPTIIESRVVVDAIEYQQGDEHRGGPPMYHVVFHAELPEHVVQHLFAHHVQDGGLNVEFQPADAAVRRRDTLVRR